MKKRITITTCLWTLILLVAGLASCDDEIDYGRTSEISSNSVVQKVLVWNGEAYQNPDNENRIRLGSQVRLEGNNLEQVTAVYFNGKEVSAETFAASAKTYIETAIPDDTPIGYEAGEWRDTLIVRSPINEFGMPLTIISKEFNIIAVAKFNNDGITVGNAVTQAQLRDKIQLQGTGLNYVTEVYVNGLQLSDFEKSEATINLTIPEKTPIGERAGTDANIIRLVNEFGEELEYGFTIIGQQPVLTHVADADGTVITSALCGETVQAVGKYLESVSGITCNGVSVTTYEVDAEGTNITFTIPENLPTGESSRSGALLPPSPLRTVRDTFASYGSSNSKFLLRNRLISSNSTGKCTTASVMGDDFGFAGLVG